MWTYMYTLVLHSVYTVSSQSIVCAVPRLAMAKMETMEDTHRHKA